MRCSCSSCVQAESTNQDGEMVAARGEDTSNPSLEKFALAGRPMHINVAVTQRIKALGATQLPPEIRRLAIEEATKALDSIAGKP